MEDDFPELGELEREVMQLVWAHASISAESVPERLRRRLKESTVRTVLRRLEEKGFVTHDVEGRTFIFRPVQDRRKVAAKGSGVLPTGSVMAQSKMCSSASSTPKC